MAEVDHKTSRRIRRRPTAWIRPLGYLASIRGVPAFSSFVAVLHSSSRSTALTNNRPAFLRCRAAGACGGRGCCCGAPGCSRGKRGTSRNGSWELCSSIGIADENIGEESEDDDGAEGVSLFPDTLGPTAPVGVTAESWERVKRSARDKRLEDERLSPNPKHTPRHVATVTLQALGRNDVPYPNHGCEVAIRFSSSSNPASGFTPGGMRTYLDDPSMTFYRILGDWDEMGPPGDPEMDDGGNRACQQIRVRRNDDPAWSAVNLDLVREEGCWLIQRLWVDDKSVAGGRAGEGGESPPRALTVAELFDEDRLEIMSCKYADYDPARLAAAGGDWLEEYPNTSLSPKAVALTCIISLRQNTGATSESNRRNEGCERVIRFCSPTNVASTLTPAHFAKYLTDPWYSIFKEWDELAFHSEDVSEDGNTADLVVLLRPEGEEAWTSVNWELVKCDGMWLTEKIWVVDV